MTCEELDANLQRYAWERDHYRAQWAELQAENARLTAILGAIAAREDGSTEYDPEVYEIARRARR